jgi:hypothetical protein
MNYFHFLESMLLKYAFLLLEYRAVTILCLFFYTANPVLPFPIDRAKYL